MIFVRVFERFSSKRKQLCCEFDYTCYQNCKQNTTSKFNLIMIFLKVSVQNNFGYGWNKKVIRTAQKIKHCVCEKIVMFS